MGPSAKAPRRGGRRRHSTGSPARLRSTPRPPARPSGSPARAARAQPKSKSSPLSS